MLSLFLPDYKDNYDDDDAVEVREKVLLMRTHGFLPGGAIL
jgi:hypothetical protein